MKYKKAITALALAALLLAGCAAPQAVQAPAPQQTAKAAETQSGVTFTDAMGYPVTVQSWNRVVSLYGSFATTGKGHGTDRALVAGLLGLRPDDPRLPDSFALAAQQGMQFSIHPVELRSAHPNTAVVETWSADGKTLVMQASSLGGGRIMVNKLDGIDVNFTGMYNTLVIRNEDASGTVAAVTSILSQLRINVANMSLYRHKRGGDALMVIETDQHLKPHQVAFLSELPGILSMTYYDKEEDEDVSGFDEGDL